MTGARDKNPALAEESGSFGSRRESSASAVRAAKFGRRRDIAGVICPPGSGVKHNDATAMGA